MAAAKLGKDFLGWTRAAVGDVVAALTDCFFYAGAGGDVEQALVGSDVLDDGLGFASNGKDDGALALFELLYEITGPAEEGGEALDVFGDIKHRLAIQLGHPFGENLVPASGTRQYRFSFI
jgi:hypothetical protein